MFCSDKLQIKGVVSKPASEVLAMPQRAVAGAVQTVPAVSFAAITPEMKQGTAFRVIRQEWINKRLKGKRDKRAKEAAEATDKKDAKPAAEE